jgi:hypothetical protein
MYGIDRSDINYFRHVQGFLNMAEKHRLDNKATAILCPCVDCRNFDPIIDSRVILGHLIMRGFTSGYTCWTNHGECSIGDNNGNTECPLDTNGGPMDTNEANDHYVHIQDTKSHFADATIVHVPVDHLEYMIHDVTVTRNLSEAQASQVREILVRERETPLYPGSSDNRLSFTTELLRFKVASGWSDKSFTDLLNFLADKLPKGNMVPRSTTKAKKILCPIELKYEKIHVCPNDCIIYWGKHKNNISCPTCDTSRYKKIDNLEELGSNEKKKIPAKVFWYFPVIPRLERLFANPASAKLLRWHADERKKDGKLRHPADASQWREIDSKYEIFAKESRNIRFALSTDGMNPFGNMTTTHSTWPVLLSIYNLPPWLCIKRKYIMLSVLIPGPKQPGNDIDVYLEPLVQDLLKLWETGVEVWDACKKEYFNLRALLFCTIHDYKGLGNIAGLSTQGYKACYICQENTNSRYLKIVENLYTWDIVGGHTEIIHTERMLMHLMGVLKMKRLHHAGLGMRFMRV